jgi:outer membrane protein assembly factor BamB
MAHLDRNGDGALQIDEIPLGRAKDAFASIDFDRSGGWDKAELQGFVDAPVASGRNVLVAVRGGGRGDVTESHVLWEKTKGLPYVASPLLHAGRLYYVKKGGFMSSVDVKSGTALYEAERLGGGGGEYYASPVGIGDRVLVGSVRGTMFVLGAGDRLEIVSRNDFGEGIFATPAVVENTMYLRTARHLWAIGGATVIGE